MSEDIVYLDIAAAKIKDGAGQYSISFNGVSSGEGTSLFWAGKTAVINGDSIAHGNLTSQTDTVPNPFTELACKKLGITVLGNYAIGGASISPDSVSVMNNYSTMPQADLCILSAGTNDFGHNKPLGALGDTSTSSFYGALHTILSSLIVKYDYVVVCTPLQRNYNTNSIGLTLKNYRDAIIESCEHFGIPCVDMWGSSGLNPVYRPGYFIDGLHPYQTGHDRMAGLLLAELKKLHS